MWLIIGTIGVLFSLDEVASLHETFLQILHIFVYGETEATLASNAWLLLLPFILLAGGFLLRLALNELPKKTFVLFLSGGALLVFGAVFVDVFNVSLDKTSFLSQGIVVAVEETLEILAAIIVLYALIDYAETKHRVSLRRLTHPS